MAVPEPVTFIEDPADVRIKKLMEGLVIYLAQFGEQCRSGRRLLTYSYK